MSELLAVERLSVEYKASGRRRVRAVDDVSFTVTPGETLALVGESGSGKSTIGRALLGLTPVHSGRVLFEDKDITHRSRATQRALASQMQVVFQDPYSSLNPSKTIGASLSEPLRALGGHTRLQAESKVGDLLHRVGLPADAAMRYPSRFSGGQRQRIVIARALAMSPRLIVCDEPTSALDVSTQAQVLELLIELQLQLGVAYLFITHDLAVVRHFADRVMVLRNGGIVEEGSVSQVCEAPTTLYTQQLLAAAPVPDPDLQRQRRELRQRLSLAQSD